ncbi:MAG: tRNA guanosine(34) transglycosylase Tgt [Gemmatimonadaceae bacterium]|nr:tRNA guanosine(34) transglycosylase Tgt [Gemmatimonadaceae bacterium]
MTAPDFSFRIDATEGRARAGAFTTPRGVVETPAFMPVGTLATVKSLDPAELRAMGAQMILANAYHLHLRPGDDLVRELGGVQRFSGWDGPMLTDSGGFQVFSLAQLNTVSEDGVEFRSHIDGALKRFTPESVMAIETNLGADVMMQFDHVIPGQSAHAASADASARSLRWLARCRAEFDRLHAVEGAPRQALFPIVQGGVHADLRRAAAAAIGELGARGTTGDAGAPVVRPAPWHGWAIGGLSVGEAKPDMYAMLEVCDAAIPADRPRYLMGVGYPEDLLEGVARGVDLFDCVAPTRFGRTGAILTSRGRVNIKRAEFRRDPRPLEEGCACATCRRFSRAYVRHLVAAEEVLGLRLLSLHNVHFLIALMRRAREAIRAGTFTSWSREWLARFHAGSPQNQD